MCPRDVLARDFHHFTVFEPKPDALSALVLYDPEQLALQAPTPVRQRSVPLEHDLASRESLEVAGPHERTFDARRGDLEDVALAELRSAIQKRFELARDARTILKRHTLPRLRVRPIDTQTKDRPRSRAGPFQLDEFETQFLYTSTEFMLEIASVHGTTIPIKKWGYIPHFSPESPPCGAPFSNWYQSNPVSQAKQGP